MRLLAPAMPGVIRDRAAPCPHCWGRTMCPRGPRHRHATCVRSMHLCRAGAWQRPPASSYPAAFRRRAIEGWAIVSFDLAPWGATGNFKVLVSEPADTFGQQAQQNLARAHAYPSSSGAKGCVVKIVFRMPDRDADQTGDDGDL
ncbi:MAG: hypothetical protein CVT77_13320 [Alphaproteobacteria bacterium HGW-Alphaproteobacteria-16]|nr:MAG: hypothetical protein CVT77_13320 [Alphaproteobacteria bacterium HGW-Alphaproteobacteria-16]